MNSMRKPIGFITKCRRIYCQVSSKRNATSTASQPLQPTKQLMDLMENDANLRAKVERILKEFEIYEYFSNFSASPAFFNDNHWAELLKTKTVIERVSYLNYMALNESRFLKDQVYAAENHKLKQEHMDKQLQLYNSGGMGYSKQTYSLILSQYENSFHMKRKYAFDHSLRLLRQMETNDMPRILFDCQFFPSMSQVEYKKSIKAAAHAYFLNSFSNTPFPISFINVLPKDPSTMKFFLNNISYMRDFTHHSIQLDLYTNDPFHRPEEVDPEQQVIYFSRHARYFMDGPLIHKAYVIPLTFEARKQKLGAIGAAKRSNYRVMCLPIRKYIQWKSGPMFLSWVVVFNVLREVAHNGGDWDYALRKYIPKIYLRTTNERIEKMGVRRYEKMQEKRVEKFRLSNLITEALGESHEIFE